MSLRKYDLNLLTILDALLRHRNVTQAGQELGLTQSATSHALLRLREQFDDKLLVASGRTMMLTHKAESLVGPIADILRQAERVLDTKKFDPATAIRRFKIGMGDYVGFLLMPRLLNALETDAPNVTIHATWTGKDMASRLKLREVDLSIGAQPPGDETLHSQPLFVDELVVIVSKKHPKVKNSIDLETFNNLPYAAFRHEAAGPISFVDFQLTRSRVLPRESVYVPNFLMLPFVVATTSHVALIQRRLAERMMTLAPIRLLTPPFRVEPLQISAFWSHEANKDLGHRWLRELIAGICSTF